MKIAHPIGFSGYTDTPYFVLRNQVTSARPDLSKSRSFRAPLLHSTLDRKLTRRNGRRRIRTRHGCRLALWLVRSQTQSAIHKSAIQVLLSALLTLPAGGRYICDATTAPKELVHGLGLGGVALCRRLTNPYTPSKPPSATYG